MWLYHRVSPKDADWMANSVDLDKTAPTLMLKSERMSVLNLNWLIFHDFGNLFKDMNFQKKKNLVFPFNQNTASNLHTFLPWIVVRAE